MRTSSRLLAGVILILLVLGVREAGAQSNEANGTVVSASTSTLVIRTGEGQYQLFVLGRETIRPQTIQPQAQVTVVYQPAGDDVTPTADAVTVTAPPPPKVAALTGEAAPPPADEPVPASVRQLERSIQRQSRRYRLGVRGGTALDPELFLFGVHSQLGPFFAENLWARPNLELGFGELTTLVALNFEAAYRLPVLQRGSRWNVYVGGGPGLNFSRRSFEEETDRDRFDFSDLDLDVGFNFLIGIANRQGLFMELKSTAYSIPSVRLGVGYNF